MRLSIEQVAVIRREVAQIAGEAARVSRSIYGRKVDVLIQAPNLLSLPIHAIARAEGVRL